MNINIGDRHEFVGYVEPNHPAPLSFVDGTLVAQRQVVFRDPEGRLFLATEIRGGCGAGLLAREGADNGGST